MRLDRLDRRLLALLQGNGRMANAEIAPEAGLSESSSHRRIKRLERNGVIQGYAAVVDGRALGLTVTGLRAGYLGRSSSIPAPKTSTPASATRPHIVECHAMSGTHGLRPEEWWREISTTSRNW